MIKQFYQNHKNDKIDFDGHHGYQCVDLFRQFIKEHIGELQPAPVYGASQFYSNYSKDEILKKYFSKMYLSSHSIEPNDIIIFPVSKTNPFGHIAIVYSVNNNDVQVVEQDGFTQQGVKIKVYKAKQFFQVLRPKNLHPNNTKKTKKNTTMAILAILSVFALVFSSCSTTPTNPIGTGTNKIDTAHGQTLENITSADKSASDISASLAETNNLIDQLEDTLDKAYTPALADNNLNDLRGQNKALKAIIFNLKAETLKMATSLDTLQYQLDKAELNLKSSQTALTDYKSEVNTQINKLVGEQRKLINRNRFLKKTLNIIIFTLILLLALIIIAFYLKSKRLKWSFFSKII